MIYRPWNDGLGDHWATCSLLRTLAQARCQRQRLSTHGLNHRHAHRLDIINRLLVDAHLIELVPEPPTSTLNGFDVWAAPLIRSTHAWEWPHCRRTVAYHFDGVSSAEDKNPPLREQQAMLAWLRSRQLDVIQLGGDRFLPEVVEILATSVLFIGCDSGFSHMAHSVGTPCFLYEHKLPVITCHRQKQHVIVRSAADFESQARMLLDLFDMLAV